MLQPPGKPAGEGQGWAKPLAPYLPSGARLGPRHPVPVQQEKLDRVQKHSVDGTSRAYRIWGLIAHVPTICYHNTGCTEGCTQRYSFLLPPLKNILRLFSSAPVQSPLALRRGGRCKTFCDLVSLLQNRPDGFSIYHRDSLPPSSADAAAPAPAAATTISAAVMEPDRRTPHQPVATPTVLFSGSGPGPSPPSTATAIPPLLHLWFDRQ